MNNDKILTILTSAIQPPLNFNLTYRCGWRVTMEGGDILQWKYYHLNLSCSLIKSNLQRAKITIRPFHHIYSILYPPARWTNWPMNEYHVSKLNWRQFSPCHNRQVNPTSIITMITYLLTLKPWVLLLNFDWLFPH